MPDPCRHAKVSLMEGAKRIAVIVREPAAEALRYAAGLTTVIDDLVVVIADHELRPDAMMAEHLEAISLMGARLVTNHKSNDFEFMDDDALAALMLGCDKVVAY